MRLKKGALKNVKAFGSGPPADSKYQEVYNSEFTQYRQAGEEGSLYNKYRFVVNFNNGFTLTEWLNVPLDESGDVLPGLKDSQVSGNLAAIKTILIGCGYSLDDIDGAEEIDLEAWLTAPGRRGCVELTPGRAPTDREKQVRSSGGSLPRDCYASIKWMGRKAWEAAKKAEATAVPVNGVMVESPARRGSKGLPVPEQGCSLM